jgi:hypothetical protein
MIDPLKTRRDYLARLPEGARGDQASAPRICQSAFKFGSDAISMMFTAAQVAPINLA